jgi:hypothetical protein
MSADFEKVLVKDPRLDVVDSIKYAVVKGGQNVTASPFPAISESNSQVIWNIQVPSEQTIIDRRVIWQSTLSFTTGAESSTQIYGVTWALASFPLHQLLTVMQVTINNNTVSCNINDALPAIIRLLCCDDLCAYNSGSPTFADTQSWYSTSTHFNNLNNPLTSLWGCTDSRLPHRGCFAPDANPSLGVAQTSWSFTLQEPLLISPFIFSNLRANSQGFYGIQNMNIVLNKNAGQSKRVARGQVTVSNVSTNSGPNPSSRLLFMFLTPHPSDLMPARNIVPFYELPRYLNNGPANAMPTSAVIDGNGLYVLQLPLSKDNLILNTLQLNQIPDKLIIYVRPTPQDTSLQPDVALPFDTISINFNNNSGILASATTYQLWEMSRGNGLTSTWNDYRGIGTSVKPSGPPNADPYTIIGTVGSYLVLEFGKDIQLTEDFYAAGSLGNFNLQVTLTGIKNNTINNIAAGGFQVVMITMNSGVFVNERGTSSTYTGILTKQDVLEASQQDHYTHDDVGRMVGGFDFFGAVKSGLSGIANKGMEMGKKALHKHGKKLLKTGTKMAHGALEKYLK